MSPPLRWEEGRRRGLSESTASKPSEELSTRLCNSRFLSRPSLLPPCSHVQHCGPLVDEAARRAWTTVPLVVCPFVCVVVCVPCVSFSLSVCVPCLLFVVCLFVLFLFVCSFVPSACVPLWAERRRQERAAEHEISRHTAQQHRGEGRQKRHEKQSTTQQRIDTRDNSARRQTSTQLLLACGGQNERTNERFKLEQRQTSAAAAVEATRTAKHNHKAQSTKHSTSTTHETSTQAADTGHKRQHTSAANTDAATWMPSMAPRLHTRRLRRPPISSLLLWRV